MLRTILTTAAFIPALAGTALAFNLTSSDIVAGEAIPQRFAFDAFGCTGENVSPALAWADAPEGTESFAVFVHDADAQTGGAGFWHWVVVDVPVEATALPQGAGSGDGLPEGAREMATDFGAPGWGGPCPPVDAAAHTYAFTVYALPVAQIEVSDEATASFTGFMVNQMALGSATFTATYDR